MGDLELIELLNRIGAAFWSVFTEEEKARTPEVDRELKELVGKIAARRDRIREISAGSQPVMFESTEVLQAMIRVYWEEVWSINRERGSIADKKLAKFYEAIKATDPNPDQDPDLLMHLFFIPMYRSLSANPDSCPLSQIEIAWDTLWDTSLSS